MSVVSVHFHIHYETVFGAHVTLCSTDGKEFDMQWSKGHNWRLTLPLTKQTASKPFVYYYRVDERMESLKRRRTLRFNGDKCAIHVFDQWRDSGLSQNAMLTSAFAECVFGRAERQVTLASLRAGKEKGGKRVTVRLRLACGQVNPAHAVGVLGSNKQLGAFQESLALRMCDGSFPVWEAELSVDRRVAFEYKYVLVERASGSVVAWESGANRVCAAAGDACDVLVRHDEVLRIDIPLYRGAGVAVPVFSLRGRADECGVGDFGSLEDLVDWAAEIGLSMIQLLPINDTVRNNTFHDSYPYAAVSVHALHPLYLNLHALGELESAEARAKYAVERVALNQLPEIDYVGVIAAKLKYARLVYNQRKGGWAEHDAFRAFVRAASDWLRPYAVFAALRDEHGTPDTARWSRLSAFPRDDAVLQREFERRDAQFHAWLQWMLDAQLRVAAAHARSRGIVLKGDIPIGIYRHSVDAWRLPHLFNMSVAAGAPPDDFATLGQNWGFPTYNWRAMERDRYAWWRQRLQHMARYFDAFRIDHILGFFRIWQIPAHAVDGLLGQFAPQRALRYSELGVADGVERKRLFRPFITNHELWLRFGDAYPRARDEFCEACGGDGVYTLRAGYQTQVDIDASIDARVARIADAESDKLIWYEAARSHLHDLVRQVVLLRADGKRYDERRDAAERDDELLCVPRIDMTMTRSFECLEEAWVRRRLHQVYVDFFYRRNEELWRHEAAKKLPAICTATDMLVCGEDLGMVPACVAPVMADNEILSLEVQRMPKDTTVELGDPAHAPHLSVVTTSSHDTSTLRGFWHELQAGARYRAWRALGGSGAAPHTMDAQLAQRFVAQHLESPAMWAVFPIQDLFALDELTTRDGAPSDERINVPANPKHYWRYRMHLSVQQMRKIKPWNRKLKDLLHQSRRGQTLTQ